jgi:cyanophycin synthetase
MRVGDIRALTGPNVYSHRPVLSMRLYLDDLAGKESREFPGFNELLLELLPGLANHHCCMGREGGFAERLPEGVYFGHIVEHVALELTEFAGVPVYHGKTRSAGEPGAYNVIIEYKAEEGTKRLLRLAAEIIESLILQAKGGEPFPLEKRLDEVRKFIAGAEFGPTTSAITEAATRRGIPWKRVGEGSLVQLGYGKHRRLIQAAMTDQTGAVAVDIASDKEMTKIMLDEITAMRMAIEEIEPGDVVVIFYDKLDLALSLLEQFGAKTAQSVPRPVYSAESFLQSATGREAEGRRGK